MSARVVVTRPHDVPMMITFPEAPFTAAQAAELGIDRRELYDACRGGHLVRPIRGVFLDATAEDSPAVRAQCVALVANQSTVVVDRTAAWIHGVDTFDLPEKQIGPVIETCVLPGRTRTRRDGVDGRTRDLISRDVMRISGLLVTTPLRTCLDLGCRLRERDALATIDAFRRQHGLTLAELNRELTRYAGRRGVVQLRVLIPLSDPRAESARESWTRLEIVKAGFPAPRPQFWIEIDGVPVYRLDLAYVTAKVVVEYDGLDFHEKSQQQREHDEKRREWLRRNGWTVIVVRRGDFSGAGLDRWLSELRRALFPTYSNRRW